MIIDRENNTVKDIYLLTFGVANLNNRVYNRDSFKEDIVGKEFKIVTTSPTTLEEAIQLKDVVGVVATKLEGDDLLGDAQISPTHNNLLDYFENGYTLTLHCLGLIEDSLVSNCEDVCFFLTPSTAAIRG